MNVPFSGFDQRTMSFYHRIFGNVMLNLHSVRMGYFPTLLCETEDVDVIRQWAEARGNIAAIIRQKNAEANKQEPSEGPP